jgi:hypothetical protein
LASYAYVKLNVGNTSGYIWGNHDYSGGLGTIFRDDLVISTNWQGVTNNTDNFSSSGTFLSNSAISIGRNGIRLFTATNSPSNSLPVQRMVVTNSGRFGIGIEDPQESVQIANGGLRITGTGNESGGVVSVNAGLISGVPTIYTLNYSSLQFKTAGAVRQYIDTAGNVGIGTTTPTHKLSVNGSIRAKEVIVETTGWSDYVLAKGYRLAPLSEVEDHIQEHGTLPGIPSASQVAGEGVSLGEMQAKLLAKVEELTLHLIRVDKENAALKERLSRLEQR